MRVKYIDFPHFQHRRNKSENQEKNLPPVRNQPRVKKKEENSMKLMFTAALLAALITGIAAAEAVHPIFKEKDGVALKGYDVVAYFSQSKAVAGKKEFEHEWMGARWRFANAENRDLFAKSPEKYAPQYGGYCAYGVADGHLSPTEPDAWKIV